MDLHLHFGAGLNQLPEPWLNLGPAHDIRKHLKFGTGSAQAIVAEHVIEHVPFLQAMGFFRECVRVLRPGGVLRVAFPDVSRFLVSDSSGIGFNAASLRYGDALAARPGLKLPSSPRARVRAALEQLLTGWGHQTAWTEQTGAGALLVAGFTQVARRQYGHGELAAIDGHHLDVGGDLALLESTILEARR
jgi:SAM-dependent methyltransferase